MAENADAKSDERFALGLLMDHLTSGEEVEFLDIKMMVNDPPDLAITWKNGEQWGVEVTRTYQQVDQFGKPGAVSSERAGAFLRAFGNNLAVDTDSKRLRDYTLYLEDPEIPPKQWMQATRESIERHIVSGKNEVLNFPGGSLRPGCPGKRWIVMIGNPIAEIDSATTDMLRYALKGKAKDLTKWKEKFSERWLLLLNCYPLVDDSLSVESTLRGLVDEAPELGGFDGVFWSGYPDRTLIRIAFS